METLYPRSECLKPYTKREIFFEKNSKIDFDNLEKFNLEELRNIARELGIKPFNNKQTLIYHIRNIN